MADISLNARSAVKGSPETSSFFVTTYPNSGEEDSPSSWPTRRSLIVMPSDCAAFRTDSHLIAVSELNACPLMNAIRRCPSFVKCSIANVAARVIQDNVRDSRQVAVPGYRD